MALSNNLTVSIGADSSKLRADLALAQARLKEFGREVRLAAEEARKTGETRHLQAAAARYQELTERVRGLRRELTATNAAHGAVVSRFDQMGTAITGATKSLSLFRGTLIGMALSSVTGPIKNVVGDVLDNIKEIRNISTATGFAPLDVQVWQEALEAAGVSTDVARQSLVRFADAMFDAKLKAGDFSTIGTGGVRVLRGIGDAAKGAARDVEVFRGSAGQAATVVDVFRGGVNKVIRDMSEPLAFLPGFDPTKFDDAKERLIAFAKEWAKLNAQAPDAALGVGRAIFGRQFDLIAEPLKRIAETGVWADIGKELTATGRAVDKNVLDKHKEMEKALDSLGDRWQAITMKLVTEQLPQMTQAVNTFTQSITVSPSDDVKAAWASFVEWFNTNIAGELAKSNAVMAENMARNHQGAAGAAQTAWQQFFSWFNNQKAAAGTSMPGSPTFTAPIPPMAAGGYIRGAGSATSDSILARLSNGEFVMRADAVQHWGAGLLSAMNATGVRRFAEGGLVVAGGTGGGNNVTVVLDGRPFAMRADQDVADALVRTARGQQMRSAGVKPGWYGR